MDHLDGNDRNVTAVNFIRLQSSGKPWWAETAGPSPLSRRHHEKKCQMPLLRSIAPLCGLLLLWTASAGAQERPSSPVAFDAAKAWSSFEKLLREQYGYFDREGVDGDAILSAFATRAKAARSDKAFIDTLQLVSHNFADPHFIVGPFDAEDWAIIPTASDMFGIHDGKAFRIGEVRSSGDALAKGIRPGITVLRIDGQTPHDAIEAITGRRFETLSPNQVGFAFNVALAGHRKRARSLETVDGERRRTFMLAATSDQAKHVQEGPLLDVERHGTLGIIRINNSLGDQGLVAQFSRALATLSDTATLLIDLRNTPSGGNTSVARGIMGHFVDHDRPYQTHVIPYETRVLGPTRKFTEYVAPYGTHYAGKVYVAGGHWTGSMGEGLMIGFDAIGATTVGTDLAHLLGALSNETIEGTAAKVDIGSEQLFTVTGLPREDYRPQLYLVRAERGQNYDPVLTAIGR
jgi:carboxyl-terminal processing protease